MRAVSQTTMCRGRMHLAAAFGMILLVTAAPARAEGGRQGAIDGALSTITVFTTFQYVDVAKYVLEVDQPYVNSISEISRKWLATLPPDLQQIVREDGLKVSQGRG